MRDPETGKETVTKRPREEWQRREIPHLRIISDELWQKAEAQRQECRAAYGGKEK